MSPIYKIVKRLFSKKKRGVNAEFLGEQYKIEIKDPSLYDLAATHRSSGTSEDNERLELLGDAVLDLVVADHLFHAYPELDEGQLTKLKSKMISRDQLIHIAKMEGLSDSLVFSKQKDLDPELIIGNVLEAIYGAMYLEQGFAIVKDRAVQMFNRTCDMNALFRDLHDPKSMLLEWSQKLKKNIKYEVEPHNSNTFRAKVSVDGRAIGEGFGSSKKRAEKDASRIALGILETLDEEE